jgi:hypothetical protein
MGLDETILFVFVGLLFFNLVFWMEAFAFLFYVILPMIDWRQEHPDDPNYVPRLMRLN